MKVGDLSLRVYIRKWLFDRSAGGCVLGCCGLRVWLARRGLCLYCTCIWDLEGAQRGSSRGMEEMFLATAVRTQAARMVWSWTTSISAPIGPFHMATRNRFGALTCALKLVSKTF